MKKTGNATVAGCDVYVGLTKKTAAKRKYCLVIEFESSKDLADAIKKELVRFTGFGE